MASADIRSEAARINWFHSIELEPGFVTPGRADTSAQLQRLHLPDLRGKTVLDVGAWDGFFSFEAERRGAARVVAVDTFSWQPRGTGTGKPASSWRGALWARTWRTSRSRCSTSRPRPSAARSTSSCSWACCTT